MFKIVCPYCFNNDCPLKIYWLILSLPVDEMLKQKLPECKYGNYVK